MMTATVFSTIALHPTITADQDFAKDWQLLAAADPDALTLNSQIEHYVNGKGLACPMPLLKLKMALKKTTVGNHVYLTATDANSKRDIAAFCQHAGYALFQSTTSQTATPSDTIFHSIITKNC